MSPASRSVVRWCEALAGLIDSRCAMSVVDRGRVEVGEDRGAGGAEQPGESVGRVRAFVPEGGDAAGRVDQGRLPRLQVGRGRARPLECRRHHHQPAAVQRDRRVADARDVEWSSAHVTPGWRSAKSAAGPPWASRRARCAMSASRKAWIRGQAGSSARSQNASMVSASRRISRRGCSSHASESRVRGCSVAEELDVVADLPHRRPPQCGQVVLDPAERTGGRGVRKSGA